MARVGGWPARGLRSLREPDSYIARYIYKS